MEMWTYYTLTMSDLTIAGGIPRHPEIVRRWQEAVTGGADTAEGYAERIKADLGTMLVTEDVQAIWTGFLSDDDGLYIEERQVKAMLKESANIVKKFFPNTKGKTPPLKSQLAERVFVSPKKIHLGRTEPDQTVERPIHVMTAQGPRTALKRVDICKDLTITVRLKVLDDKVITEKILSGILGHAEVNGLGTDRSQGMGQFNARLEAE